MMLVIIAVVMKAKMKMKTVMKMMMVMMLVVIVMIDGDSHVDGSGETLKRGQRRPRHSEIRKAWFCLWFRHSVCRASGVTKSMSQPGSLWTSIGSVLAPDGSLQPASAKLRCSTSTRHFGSFGRSSAFAACISTTYQWITKPGWRCMATPITVLLTLLLVDSIGHNHFELLRPASSMLSLAQLLLCACYVHPCGNGTR